EHLGSRAKVGAVVLVSSLLILTGCREGVNDPFVPVLPEVPVWVSTDCDAPGCTSGSGSEGVVELRSNPPGLACDPKRYNTSTCQFGFLPGTAVTLTAIMEDGWVP